MTSVEVVLISPSGYLKDSNNSSRLNCIRLKPVHQWKLAEAYGLPPDASLLDIFNLANTSFYISSYCRVDDDSEPEQPTSSSVVEAPGPGSAAPVDTSTTSLQAAPETGNSTLATITKKKPHVNWTSQGPVALA
uniref:Uncharacterized protein n=1 Tax=Moniliophthora roreri TaxID=221103 RepID=A0A0W0FDU6_MONRR